MNNEAFVEYYKAQGIVPAEEWDTFIEWLRKPLPMTFRINGSGHQAAAIRDKLKVSGRGQDVAPHPTCMSPLPDEAWSPPSHYFHVTTA